MSHFARIAVLPSSMKLVCAAALLVTGACAARPAEPPAAPPSPSTAFAQASTGVAEQQASPDDIVFVETEHKEPVTHESAAPATSLRVEPSAGKQRLSHITAPQ